MSLTKDQEEYYEALEEMFLTKAWKKYFLEEVFQQYEASKEMLENADLSNESIREIRGGLRVLKSILDYERYVVMAKEQAEQEEDDAEAAL